MKTQMMKTQMMNFFSIKNSFSKTQLIYIFILCFISFGIKAQNIVFADANFKAKLLQADVSNTIALDSNNQAIKIDTNGDGEISISEASNVGSLKIESEPTLVINSFEGILNFTNIEKLWIHSFWTSTVSTLNINGLSKLKTLIAGGFYAGLTSLIIKDLPALQELNLNVDYDLITNLDIQNLPSLTILNITGNQRNQTDSMVINLQNFPKLKTLKCTAYINFQNLNSSTCPLLEEVEFQKINNTSIDLSNSTNLKTIKIISWAPYKVSNINLSNCSNLETILCYEGTIKSLKANGCSKLKTLNCSWNSITGLDIAGCLQLNYLDCSYNELSSINLSNSAELQYLDCSANSISFLDLRNNSALQTLYCYSNNLGMLFIKNGSKENIDFSGNPNLEYICCDDSQLLDINNDLTTYGYSNVSINTYCSFVPGGNYNTITGIATYDANNNGCDTSDEKFEHLKLKINDGTNTGETFTNNLGEYNFYTQSGNFTVTAEAENPNFFTVTPSSFSTSFADNNNNVFTQNFCVTANGTHPDLEVVIAPIIPARPGFSATYKLTYRNKGNQTQSGNVALTFDNSKMSFTSSTVPTDSSTANQLVWNFTNLKPYENKAIDIEFLINTPTNPTHPVSNGDLLNFGAVVNPTTGDDLPNDNTFGYQQTVVSSFNPNDIVCVQGNSVPNSMIGEYLHYMINFENTGTSEIENIVIEMDINPEDYDISTLQLQNSTAPVYTRITGNKVEFILKKIKLGSGGHGNVLMKIKSKEDKPIGSNVSNKANIYFDYNLPISTNDVITNFEKVLQIDEVKDNSVAIYPIPTKGEVTISADSKITSVEIYDSSGRIVQKQFGNAATTKLVMKSASNGSYYFKIHTSKGVMVKKVIKE